MQRLLAVAQGLGDLLAQRLEVELGAGGVHPAALGDALADGGHLGGAEEEAVEDEVEDPPVLLGLGQRGGQALLEVHGLRSTGTSRRTAKASSSSLVPTATPSPRSSSPSSRMRALIPGGDSSGSPPP